MSSYCRHKSLFKICLIVSLLFLPISFLTNDILADDALDNGGPEEEQVCDPDSYDDTADNECDVTLPSEDSTEATAVAELGPYYPERVMSEASLLPPTPLINPTFFQTLGASADTSVEPIQFGGGENTSALITAAVSEPVLPPKEVSFQSQCLTGESPIVTIDATDTDEQRLTKYKSFFRKSKNQECRRKAYKLMMDLGFDSAKADRQYLGNCDNNKSKARFERWVKGWHGENPTLANINTRIDSLHFTNPKPEVIKACVADIFNLSTQSGVHDQQDATAAQTEAAITCTADSTYQNYQNLKFGDCNTQEYCIMAVKCKTSTDDSNPSASQEFQTIAICKKPASGNCDPTLCFNQKIAEPVATKPGVLQSGVGASDN